MSPQAPPGRLGRLADFTHRRRRTVVLAWVVAARRGVRGRRRRRATGPPTTPRPGSESRAAAELLQERFPARSPDTVDVVWQAAAGADAPARPGADRPARDGGAPGLEGIGDAAPRRAGRLLAPTARSASCASRSPSSPARSRPRRASGSSRSRDAGGGRRAARRARRQRDRQRARPGEISSEAVGLAIAAFVLLLTFGSVVAAGLPLATALFGLGISTGVIGLLAAVIDVPDWAPALASMLGIGVGIDYALLIITRYRAALAGGRTRAAPSRRPSPPPGRSVLIAGTTVVISLMGLFLMGLPYLYGAALATIAAVLVVMAASVTLVPALLAIAGPRIDRLRIPGTNRAPADPRDAPAARWGRRVQQRPWLAAIAGVAVLLVLASPFAGLRLGFPDRGQRRGGHDDAPGLRPRRRSGFGPGANGPLLVAAESRGAGDEAKLAALAGTLREQPGVAAVGRPGAQPGARRRGDLRTPATSPQDRGDRGPRAPPARRRPPGGRPPVALGGATAAFMDQSEATADRLPLFIGGVVGLSFLLLLFSFRSVTVALKAGAMNLLSIARRLRRGRVPRARAAGPGSSSASTPRRRCRRSSP